MLVVAEVLEARESQAHQQHAAPEHHQPLQVRHKVSYKKQQVEQVLQVKNIKGCVSTTFNSITSAGGGGGKGGPTGLPIR